MNYYEDQFVELYIKRGVFYAIFKEGCIVTKEVSSGTTSKRLEMSKGRKYPVIIDGRKVKYWTMDSRNHSMKAFAYESIEMTAMVLGSSTRIIFNFAIRLFPSPVESKVFSNLEEAENWIKQHSKLLN